MKYLAIFTSAAVFLFISCVDKSIISTNAINAEIDVAGTVVPADAHILFIMGKDTTEISADDDGYFSASVPTGRGTFVISAEGYRTYTTSPTYTSSGIYDLGAIELSDLPFPLSTIYKNVNYSPNGNSYLFYITFSQEMQPSSKAAVSIGPEIEGSLVWTNNNTSLYFYPNPSFLDTATFTVQINRPQLTFYMSAERKEPLGQF